MEDNICPRMSKPVACGEDNEPIMFFQQCIEKQCRYWTVVLTPGGVVQNCADVLKAQKIER